MPVTLQKPTVSIGNVHLVGSSTIGWKFQTGVHPYMATFSVLNDTWDKLLKGKKGMSQTLQITDSYGVRTEIEDVYILWEVPSTEPTITSFVVSDLRWKWNRILIARTYNLARKTGDKNFDGETLPLAGKVTTDRYDYRPYSLVRGDISWVPGDAVVDILEQLKNPGEKLAGFKGRIIIESFPAKREFPLQNVVLRDPGDVALSRLLAFIPGADVYVDQKGNVRIINTLDLDSTEKKRDGLPPPTWEGDKIEFVDRRKIRPNVIYVYYEREVEMVLEFEDDWSLRTRVPVDRDTAYVENVIPTVDPTTTVTEYDPDTGTEITKPVPPGTWVNAREWLRVMNEKHGPAVIPTALKWDWSTIRRFWISGDLRGKLLGESIRGKEVGIDTSNAISAIQALMTNFRQTFRISRRFMERIQSIDNVRAALLDPVTGMRMPSSVWGELTLKPSKPKGEHIVNRKDPEKQGLYYLDNSLPEDDDNLVKTEPGLLRVTFIDKDAGIFRLEGMNSPYGDIAEIIPGFTVNAQNQKPMVPTCHLAHQDDKPMSAGMRLQTPGKGSEIFWSDTYQFKAMVTIVPGAPNNKAAFHVEKITADDLVKLFGDKFRIKGGEGPPIEVFIPAGENVTARFAWRDDEKARKTIGDLLGLNDDDPTNAGIFDDPETKRNEARHLDGFVLVNEQRGLWSHSRAVAAEVISPYSDSIQGRHASRVPQEGFELKGNMRSAAIQVKSYPSAMVDAVHEFSGQVRPVSRMALMSETARKVILGIVRFK